MTAHNDLDRQLTDFLREGPDELPYESFDAVRDRTERTGQRIVIGPWSLPAMNMIVTIGLGAVAAVVVILIVGAQLLGSPGGGFGAGSGDEPSATAEPTATFQPSPSAAAGPPISQVFTSTLHGISLSYPQGWTVQPATEPWTDATFPLEFGQPHADWLSDPTLVDHFFLTVASQPIAESAPDEWVSRQMADDEGCGTATEPITVDDASGLVGSDDCTVAVVTIADRGYWIQLYTGSNAPPTVDAAAWFEEVLASVQLRPEEALDAGITPSP